jgi:hypothetical protein
MGKAAVFLPPFLPTAHAVHIPLHTTTSPYTWSSITRPDNAQQVMYQMRVENLPSPTPKLKLQQEGRRDERESVRTDCSHPASSKLKHGQSIEKNPPFSPAAMMCQASTVVVIIEM